jgi:hypothetical protein
MHARGRAAAGARDEASLTMAVFGTKPTCLYVGYLVAMGWKADFEQATSVIVLCARQGARAARETDRAKFRALKSRTETLK